MSDQTQRHMDGSAEGTAIVRVEGSAYAVPVAVLEQHRITPERRARMEAALRERATAGEAPLYELPQEALDAYRLSEEERAALEAQQAERGDDVHGLHMDFRNNPYPWQPYTGHHANEFFGGFERDQRGGKVFVGVFPAYRAPSSSGPYPGLR
jgi:hypothetical protein